MSTASWFQENAPGLIRMISSLVFPYGLSMIILTGADLCAGSFLYTTVAALHRQLSWYKMLLHWSVTFWGNLAGSLFVVAIIFGYGNVFAADPYKSEAIAFATKKQVTRTSTTSSSAALAATGLDLAGCAGDHGRAIYLEGIIPALLGNIVGAGLFAGTYYWYMYLLNGEGGTLNWMSESGTVTPCSGELEAVPADKLR
ncbi:hypothetical protein ALT_1190 [Aspergillus lentulus]|uniref:Formate transporter n=1 Tax=Aspergillus lentulus TaxID=293939 RepID=A0AAN4T7K0_ASPLE|nr:hypothetical protein ALT_1190 [Aspergillus lentulus]